MSRRISARAVVISDGKLLCVRQKKYDGGMPMDNPYWCTPGGGVDDGEALLPALHREMIEETGVAPNIGELLYVQQFMYKGGEFMDFFFHVTNAEDYLDVDLSKTSHGAAEIAEIAFIDPAKTNLLPKFLTTQNIQADIVANVPAKIFNNIN